MNIFIHTQGARDELARQWGTEPEVVGDPSQRLFVVQSNALSAEAALDASAAPHRSAVIASLKAALSAEFAELGTWDFRAVVGQTVLDVTVCKRGVILTAGQGLVAGAAITGALGPDSVLRAAKEALTALRAAGGLPTA